MTPGFIAGNKAWIGVYIDIAVSTRSRTTIAVREDEESAQYVMSLVAKCVKRFICVQVGEEKEVSQNEALKSDFNRKNIPENSAVQGE